MIICRSPLRISLGGGGTDLPSYYKNHGGYFISASINKYVYIALHESYENQFIIKYSDIEKVKNFRSIKHNLFRETLLEYASDTTFFEISSFADLPSRSGLGSSGAFSCCLNLSIAAAKSVSLSQEEIAKRSINIELNKLNEPIGIQDQYASAYGSLREFIISKNGAVTNNEILNDSLQEKFNSEFFLVYTGISRNASEYLKDQKMKSEKSDDNMINNLNKTKQLGYQFRDFLVSGDLRSYAYLMNEHWINKVNRSINISNSKINSLYEYLIESGALGAKLVGAGGGGFFLVATENKLKLQAKLIENKIKFIDFQICKNGTQLI